MQTSFSWRGAHCSTSASASSYINERKTQSPTPCHCQPPQSSHHWDKSCHSNIMPFYSSIFLVLFCFMFVPHVQAMKCGSRLLDVKTGGASRCTNGRPGSKLTISVTNGCLFPVREVKICGNTSEVRSVRERVQRCVRKRIRRCGGGGTFVKCGMSVMARCTPGLEVLLSDSSYDKSRCC